MELDPNIWGPHFWFVLHTIALTYPRYPDSSTKKKYYDFIQNLPLFLPTRKVSKNFTETLDKFPVTPYLDSRDSFIRWIHFVHNQMNRALKKKEMPLSESLNHYYQHYKPKELIKQEEIKQRKMFIFGGIIIVIISGIVYLYKK
jgi:hypothetical protein